jgi:hypothetical protein
MRSTAGTQPEQAALMDAVCSALHLKHRWSKANPPGIWDGVYDVAANPFGLE